MKSSKTKEIDIWHLDTIPKLINLITRPTFIKKVTYLVNAIAMFEVN